MAYDPATTQTIMYANTGATWAWNGTNWTEVATTGPAARTGAALAYDPAVGTSGEVVLFGGEVSATYYNDTWAWNGTAWARSPTAATPAAPPPAPPARRGATWPPWPLTAPPPAASWSCSAAGTAPPTTPTPGPGTPPPVAWAQLTRPHGQPDGPLHAPPWPTTRPWAPAANWSCSAGPQHQHQPVRHLGLERHHLGAAVPGGQPPGPLYGTMAYDTGTAQLFLFGGNSSHRLRQRHLGLDRHHLGLPRPLDQPPRRQQAAMAYDAATDQMVLFGGCAGSLRHLVDRPPGHRRQPGIGADGRGRHRHHHRLRLQRRQHRRLWRHRRHQCHRGLVQLHHGPGPGAQRGHGRRHRDHGRGRDGGHQRGRPVHLLQRQLVRGLRHGRAVAARYGSVAYDPATGQTILFGGVNSAGPTWTTPGPGTAQPGRGGSTT